MAIDVDVILDRIRSESRFPDLVGYTPLDTAPVGWAIATDGMCALLVRRDDAWKLNYAPAMMVDVLLAKPQARHMTTVEALQAWAGEFPVPCVLPCPGWEAHERFANDEDAECFYGCQFVEGLGYAYEDGHRTFGKEWGSIAGIAIDRARLAELLAPFAGPCKYGVAASGHAASLYIDGDGWRAVLCEGAPGRVEVTSTFEATQ